MLYNDIDIKHRGVNIAASVTNLDLLCSAYRLTDVAQLLFFTL